MNNHYQFYSHFDFKKITTNESAGLTDSFLDSRNNSLNSPITNNPTVPVEGGEVTLALNTAQYGRTFQDRSFTFHILPRPNDVSQDKKVIILQNTNILNKAHTKLNRFTT